jgi:hypothetical protein
MSAPGNTKDPTLSIVIYGGRRVAVQRGHNGVRVIIRKLRSTGQRVAMFFERQRTKDFSDEILPGLTPDYMVPVEILGMCVGRRDAWKRRLNYKCASCGTRHAAEDMEGEICQDCCVVDEPTAAAAVQKEMDKRTLVEHDLEHTALVNAQADRRIRMRAEAEAARVARVQAMREEAI